MSEQIVLPKTQIPQEVSKGLSKFLDSFQPYEVKTGAKLCLYLDERSSAFYLTCHIQGSILAQSCDTEATLDADDEDEIYKLNREITEDQAAYIAME
jgi:hypothetical protein